MGTANVKSVQYSGAGWNAALGQSYSPESDWPRFDVTSYTRTIDYVGKSSRENSLAGRKLSRPRRRGTPIQGDSG